MLTPFQRDPVMPDDQLHSQITLTENQLAAVRQPEGRVRLLAQIGTYYRQSADPARAIPYFQQAVEECRAKNMHRLGAVNVLRLAVAYQYAGQVDAAREAFQTALMLCQRQNFHADFAYQHYGKFLVETGEVEVATQFLERALGLRLVKGDAELIESSRTALDDARALLDPPAEP